MQSEIINVISIFKEGGKKIRAAKSPFFQAQQQHSLRTIFKERIIKASEAKRIWGKIPHGFNTGKAH